MYWIHQNQNISSSPLSSLIAYVSKICYSDYAMSSETNTVPLYRIENPNIPAETNGTTSHEDLVGQWFSPNPDSILPYLRKSTQTFGKEAHPVDGAQLVVAQVPAEQLEAHHVSRHPIASEMDVEDDNYLVPRDGSVETTTVGLDEIIGDLRGQLGRGEHLFEAKRRIIEKIGEISLN